MDLQRFRAHFRATREKHFGGRPKLSKATGVNRTTIQRIETDPTYKPGLETIATLLEAMGVRVSEFFAEIDRSQTETDYLSGQRPATTPANPQREADHAGGEISADVARVVARALIDAGTAIASAAAGASLGSANHAVVPPGRKQPHRRKRRA